jgi:putative transposase
VEQNRARVWVNLDEMVRLQVQAFVQQVMEEEVAELLGRGKSERIAAMAATAEEPGDVPHGYRNGYGKPRQLSTGIGTLTVRRPRVRGLDEPFVSRVLPLFKRHTQQVRKMLPQLYLHGLSQGDFDLALRGLLGEGAPLSSSSIARLKVSWQAEYEQWKQQPLDQEALGGRSVVYVWVDGIYVKAGLEKEKAALLVVIGALSDGSKEVLAVEAGHRESTQAWSSILRELKKRGMNSPKLVVGDGHLGIWGALANVYPEAREQRCWNHRVMNVLDRVPKKHQPIAKEMLRNIQFSQSRKEAEEVKQTFQAWARQQGQASAAELLEQDWERMVAFYSFPKEHWQHLRTTNVVESPFASVRLRTDAAKRYRKAENATAAIWKLLLVAEKTFRKLNAPELLSSVARGCQYMDGKWVKGPQEEHQEEYEEEYEDGELAA